jgi:RNA polymerase sigma-70 factor (ECF subfamily)
LRDVEAFYRRHFPVLREKCRRMLGDAQDAEDLAQETFVRLWQTALDDDDPRSISSWLYRTSTRLAIDRIRNRARKLNASSPGEEEQLQSLAASQTASDQVLVARRELESLAESLPAQELEIALLYRLDGFTQVEIAGVLQISERTVRRALSRLEERLPALRKEMSR